MKTLIYIFPLLLLTGCSTISLNKTEQTELLEYIKYSNDLIETTYKDTEPRKVLQPYRTRYRLIQPIILRIKQENNEIAN